MGIPGYWPSRWPAEDGGPRRTQIPLSKEGLRIAPGEELAVTSRFAPVCTMPVLRDIGEVFLLRHTAGPDAVAMVERIHPETLEPLATSAELAAGPVWPGGLAAHADGSLHVVFGNHAHRLSADLVVEASARLPRPAPYNSFVVLPDGHLVTKDFGGSLPGAPVAAADRRPTELVVLDPVDLAFVARLELPEASIARISADGDDVYVVGDTHLFRVRWDGTSLAIDDVFTACYRTLEGQTYGWDCVITAGAAWFLDDGEGSESYSGTLRGHGVSTAPLHLVRVDLATSAVTLAEVCGEPGGLVANPPVIDQGRGFAVGYDSGNGVLAGFAIGDGTVEQVWRHDQDHGGHLVLYTESGEVVTGDFDAERGAEQVVVRDLASGDELARADTGSPVQSVLFPSPGFARDLYLCSFATVSRVTVTGG